MPTVLSALQQTRLKTTEMAFDTLVIAGPIVSPRFFCCTAGNVVGVTKEPVAVIELTPTVICLGDAMAYDSGSSFDPDGAVASQAWDFGDGNTSAAVSGPHTYTATGTYTVTLTVRDGTGLDGSAYARVLVIDCDAEGDIASELFVGHKTAGAFYRSMDGAWAARNTGLTGNWLNIRDLKMSPHYKYGPSTTRHVWIATQAGIAHSEDDMVTWTLHYADLGDPYNGESGAAQVAKAALDWYCIAFSPYKDEVFILAGTATRSWVYWTDDYGITWNSWQVDWI